MKKIKTIFSGKRNQEAKKIKKEDDYYKELFIDNPLWNTPAPNAEESMRWQIIEKFINYVREYRFTTDVKTEFEILDLGCGRGWLSNLLSAYGKLTAIEPVIEVAAYAKKLFPGLSIEPGTAETLLENGMDGKFNLVVCSEVIEHIPDKDKNDFVSKIKRLVAPNGFAIITTPRKEAQAAWMQHSSPDQPVEEWLDEEMLKNMFMNQGFISLLFERYSAKPTPQSPDIEIYQLWLFQKQ